VLRVKRLCKAVPRAWFAVSRSSSVRGPQAQELQARVRLLAGRESSVAAHIPPVHHVRAVVIRHVREWEAQGRVGLRHRREDQRVQAAHNAVRGSRLSPEKKKDR